MQITLTPEQALALRSIGAKINGAFGGLSKSTRKAKASRRNVKKAIRARVEAAHAA